MLIIILEWKNSIEKIILFNKRRNQDFFRSTFWSTPRPKFKSPSSHPRHLASKSAFYPTPTFRVDQKFSAFRRQMAPPSLAPSCRPPLLSPKKNHFMVASPFFKASTLSTSTLRRRRRRKKISRSSKVAAEKFFSPVVFEPKSEAQKPDRYFFPTFWVLFIFYFAATRWFHFYSELTQAS